MIADPGLPIADDPQAELRLLLTNFEQYAARCLRVQTLGGGTLVPLKLRPVQHRIEREIRRQHADGHAAFIQVDKSRKLGCSTYVAGRFSHRAFTRQFQNGFVVADTGPNATRIFKIYELMHQHLPKSLQPKRAGSRGEMLLFSELNTQLEVGSAESKTFGRGAPSVQMAHLSEAAYFPDPEGLLVGMLPGVERKSDAIVICESTANGPGTWWHDFWLRSLKGISHFTPLFFGWYEDPDHWLPDAVPEEEWTEEEAYWAKEFGVTGHQIAWLRFKQDVDCQGRDDRRRRDFPCSWEESFAAVGAVAWTQEQLRGCAELMEPRFRGDITDNGLRRVPEGELLIWEQPQPGAEYVIGADPATGLQGRDYSAAEVFRVSRRHNQWPVQVAELACHEDPVSFAKKLTLLGVYYNKALLSCEVTGIGRATEAALQKTYFYPRLHRWVGWDKFKHTGDTWGWQTTPNSKDVMHGVADWLIRTRRVTLHSAHLLNEFLLYQEVKPGIYECMTEDGHGDRVMAAMIAWCSWMQHVFGGVPLKELRELLTKHYGGVSKAETQAIRSMELSDVAEYELDAAQKPEEELTDTDWIARVFGRRRNREEMSEAF